MDTMHLMVFFFLGIFHLSLAKECPGCSKYIINDPAAIQYLTNKLNDFSPKGTINEEQVELEGIKDIQRQVVKGLIYTFDLDTRGLKSNSLYKCKLAVFQQEWTGLEEIKEFNCKVLPSNEEERSIPEEDLLTDVSTFNNNLLPKSLKGKKSQKYLECMMRAAIRCLANV